MNAKEPSQQQGKDGGKERGVSSGMETISETGDRRSRPVLETIALSNKLFFQTAIVRYGSWERFLEKNDIHSDGSDDDSGE